MFLKSFKKNTVLSLLVLTVAFMAGCSKDKSKGTFTVKLTDEPVNFTQVNLHIKGVQIHYAFTDSTHDENDSGWVNLETNQGIYNLLDFQGELDTTLASSEIHEGEISQIRLVLGPNNSVVTTDNESFPLTVPSGQESGLKINLFRSLNVNEELIVTVDFDAKASIVETGSGKYLLKPVINLKKIEYK